MSIRSPEAGFSLIELMVTVAIIGLLTSIAVPNYSFFMAKSKQSEAKASLAAVYSNEIGFHSEWGTYTTSLALMGNNPTGNMIYRYGFWAGIGDFATSTANGLPIGFPLPATGGDYNSYYYCTTFPAICTCDCTVYGLDAHTYITKDTFAAGATADLKVTATADYLVLDYNKNYSVVTSGL